MTAIAQPLPWTDARARAGRRAPAPFRAPSAPSLRPARRPGPAAAPFRRRRTVAALLLAVLVGAGASAGGLGRSPLGSPGPAPVEQFLPVAERSYVVQPGDTLWAIARALQPAGDVRPLVQRLSAERGDAPLRAGERLTLPPG